MTRHNHNTTTRCGLVALIGAPNAGKSTLTNAIVGEKVSIVTHKVQTTRQRITGIAIHGDTQMVLLDTPGLFQPKERMERAMVAAALDAAKDADIRLWIIDVQNNIQPESIQAMVETLKTPFIIVLNKIDLVEKDKLLKIASLFNETTISKRISEGEGKIFMISALNDDGVSDLITYLREKLPLSPWLYPSDYVSDMPARSVAAEITREQVILQLHHELPYETYVETEAFEEFQNGDVKITQMIVVAKEGQKAIVLGHHGSRIKAIRQSAQRQLSRVLDRKVHLFLHVKVIDNWQEKRDFYALTGLNRES